MYNYREERFLGYKLKSFLVKFIKIYELKTFEPHFRSLHDTLLKAV